MLIVLDRRAQNYGKCHASFGSAEGFGCELRLEKQGADPYTCCVRLPGEESIPVRQNCGAGATVAVEMEKTNIRPCAGP